MRMVGKGFFERERAVIECAVHFSQFPSTLLDADVHHISFRENLNVPSYNFKWRELGDNALCLFDSRTDILAKRPRRQNGHVCMWKAAGDQFSPQLVEKSSQRIRNINYQREEVDPRRTIGTHTHGSLYGTRFCRNGYSNAHCYNKSLIPPHQLRQ